MRKKITGILNMILAAVLAVGTRTFLHVCKGGMSMGGDSAMGSENAMGGMDMSQAPCLGIPHASLIVGIVLALTGIVFLASGNKKVAGLASGIANVILGVVTVGIPTFIFGVCSAPHMHCHMVTRPALIIVGAVVFVTGAVNAVVELRSSDAVETEAEAKLSTN